MKFGGPLAHADVIEALDNGFLEIHSTFQTIASYQEEERNTVIEAQSLASKMDKLENVILTRVEKDTVEI